jgi:hypothetical protein
MERYTEMVLQLKDWILDYKKMVGKYSEGETFKMKDDRNEAQVKKVLPYEEDFL